jgi:hypothetical protein
MTLALAAVFVSACLGLPGRSAGASGSSAASAVVDYEALNGQDPTWQYSVPMCPSRAFG